MARGERDNASGSPRLPALLAAQLIVTGAALLSQSLGHQLDSPLVTPVACASLLLFGLPHGTLDIELLRRRDGAGPLVLLVAYGACAAAMYAVWQLAPLLALSLFLAVAVEHFAEDWDEMGSRFIAYGTAVALIATPALLHRTELASIFTLLTGTAAAARLGDLLLILMPVAGIIAVAGTILLWQRGQRCRAIGLAAALLAEAVLPPVVGFSLFFCFVHSPWQLRESLRQLPLPTWDAWLRIILPLTFVAGVLALLIGTVGLLVSLDAAALRASFVTLSVLTLPHMLLPCATRRYRTRVGAAAPRRITARLRDQLAPHRSSSQSSRRFNL